MTVPVLTRISPGAGPACTSNFSMAFYQPSAYQAAPASAPAPSDPAVKLTSLPAMDVYVLSFGGFASAVDWRNSAAGLMKKLDELKLPYDAKTWFTAGASCTECVCARRGACGHAVRVAARTRQQAARRGRRGAQQRSSLPTSLSLHCIPCRLRQPLHRQQPPQRGVGAGGASRHHQCCGRQGHDDRYHHRCCRRERRQASGGRRRPPAAVNRARECGRSFCKRFDGLVRTREEE